MANSVDISKVQGNILDAFATEHVWLYFFQFGNDPNKARKWLAGIAGSGKIQSTREISKIANVPYGKKERILLHISLSAAGIKKLGLTLPPSKGIYEGRGKASKIKSRIASPDDPFRAGMKNRSDILGDTRNSHYMKWVEPYRSRRIDALIIAASDSKQKIEKEINGMTKEAKERFDISQVGIEKGAMMYENPQRKHQGIEHFGFRDGISQPLIRGVDDEKIARRRVNKDAFDPEDFVLFGLSEHLSWANNGSFLVFRRLRQDVHGFQNFINSVSRNLGLTREELAAKFMGRYTDGRPLDGYSRGASARDYNDFDYKSDPRGVHTPVFSHIRKTNPRTSGHYQESDRHRILRRGITYGPKADRLQDNEDRGLLFICYQRDLEMQFEYIQRAFANNPHFPTPGTGHDPITGQPGSAKYSYVNLGGKIELKDWVVMTGGEYFFSPSIPALKNLHQIGTDEDIQHPIPSLSENNLANQGPK
jgi:Dyp-type peroxidase family